MMTARGLTLLGLTLQTVGTLCITIQAWGPGVYRRIGRPFVFDTYEGGIVDEKRVWPVVIRVGLISYLLGYLPFFFATWMTP
jgi:hypothetical protein